MCRRARRSIRNLMIFLIKHSETTAVKAWEAKWGFTKDIYPEMYSQTNQVIYFISVLMLRVVRDTK